jgi:hypothetical protein
MQPAARPQWSLSLRQVMKLGCTTIKNIKKTAKVIRHGVVTLDMLIHLDAG